MVASYMGQKTFIITAQWAQHVSDKDHNKLDSISVIFVHSFIMQVVCQETYQVVKRTATDNSSLHHLDKL